MDIGIKMAGSNHILDMNKLPFLLGLVGVVYFAVPKAGLAGILDDTDEIKGQYIADVGTLEPLTCPLSGNYNCITWPSDLYKFGFTRCFQIHGYYGGYSSDKALLAVDSAKTISIFVVSGGFGGGLKRYRATSYACPDMY